MESDSNLQQQLLDLLEDYHSFNPGIVPVLPQPTPLEFSKQVSKGLPCVYTMFTPSTTTTPNPSLRRTTIPKDDTNPSTWPAFYWTRKSLTNAIPSSQLLPVAITPDGRADSLNSHPTTSEPIFLEPATLELSMADLLDQLTSPSSPSSPVYYLQSQNSNLTTTPSLAPLLEDLPASIPFATPVLGDPDAINIWIGDERSLTSAHRDPYENLYLVLKGAKNFTLWPPVDEVVLDAKMVHTGQWVYTNNEFSITLNDSTSEDSKIPWISIDASKPREELNAAHPLYSRARPRSVRVEAGQVLYLPAGWFHAVGQECGEWINEDTGATETAPCIAVNYWYDQDYEGEKYVMRQFVGELVKRVRMMREDA